ncbi:Hypothetical protein A7982_02048 [Minicystis rosea]|nr:Hypothetical protein A7982_02048 [Minicystis rosea]
MGPTGLATAVVGVAFLLSGYRTIVASIADLPEPLVQTAAERLGPLERAAVVVVVAVAIYLGARQLGHGRTGLYVCVALLLMNAAAVAALRIRWFETIGADRSIVARHRRGALVQMVGSWITFSGLAVYLLRP